MRVIVVPLKVALGLKKNDFWAFKKISLFFLIPKSQIFPILMQLLMVPLSQADQKLLKTIETPQLK